jgi:hypothetical protein
MKIKLNAMALLASTALAITSSSTILATSNVQAQAPTFCDSFTGVYVDQGKGVIVHIGDNRLVVYNGNPAPLNGRCVSANRIEATFGNGQTLIGRKSGNNINWSNNTIWTKQSSNVTYPLDGF